MARIGRLSCLAGLTGLLLAGPAAAQLDPRVAMPLQQLFQAAQMACQQGNPQGCGSMQQLQGLARQLTQAQFACQQGNMQACQYFQAGAQQVVGAWQQAQAGMAAGGGGGQGYSPRQMTQDHQMRQQQQQQQFQAHQNQMRQQQQMQDQNHQRFMEQLRR
ncbi:hypothetical protein [Falsiroseomonas selenitidurans]|uniref:Uncharacterized protein n=1 Tax=Falsiroseomonas selenitidurans TaxID=2716335 RepID=A0ABX1E436_9PROT|nr:hypothetical protein [Falsiroseomonas selenitidurans]NKC31543.1 hypothetical protein [Falsiroseomonas selenitidurans]